VSNVDVDDLIQATFLELPRIASMFDGRSDSCASWLCGIALRLAARDRRSVGRFLKMLVSFGRSSPQAMAVTPEKVASGREEIGRFADALLALAPKKREAFVMIELEGFSAELVAHSLGENPATIRTRLFHARSELRAAVDPE
jgi:RNA polymerase sigma-70 factor (ECF subfamily)